MRTSRTVSTHITAAILAGLFLCGSLGVAAADKQPVKKMTCCQEAKAKGKTCSHTCCIAARKKGESCARCNPNKEDLAAEKKHPAGKSLN